MAAIKIKRKTKGRRVSCGKHGNCKGYIVCMCLLRAAHPVIAMIDHPGDSHPTLGSLLCADCRDGARDVDNLTLICEFCAKDKFGITGA